MAGICFTPSLGSHSSIPPSSQSVQFLAFNDDDLPHEGILEVWTNLDGEWRGHAFDEVPSTTMLLVDVPLSRNGNGGSSSSSDCRLTARPRLAFAPRAAQPAADITYQTNSPSDDRLQTVRFNGYPKLEGATTAASPSSRPLLPLSPSWKVAMSARA